MVATAWSPPGAPSSWRLTAAQFTVLRDDPELLGVASAIAPDRVPPLLFTAAATSLILALEPDPLRGWFPRAGRAATSARSGDSPPSTEPSASITETSCSQLCARASLPDERSRSLCRLRAGAERGSRFAARDGARGCREPVPGWPFTSTVTATSSALPGGDPVHIGAQDSPVSVEVELRGELAPRVPRELPAVVDRVGIDVEPLDLNDPVGPQLAGGVHPPGDRRRDPVSRGGPGDARESRAQRCAEMRASCCPRCSRQYPRGR